MKTTLKTCLISSALALSVTTANADPGYYLGGGLAYSAADSKFPFLGSTIDSGAAVGLTFGYRFENATAFYGQSMANGLEWFGALGLGVMTGNGAISEGGTTDSGVNSGVTVGRGCSRILAPTL